MSGTSRWWSLVGLTATNLLPLWFALRGSLDTADLLLCYVLEAWLVTGLWLRDRRRPRRAPATRWSRRPSSDGALRLVGMLALGVTLVVLSVRVVRRVTWDGDTLGVVVATTLSIGLGLWLAARQRSGPTRPGSVAWRVVLLFTGAAVGLGTADNLAVLVPRGWEPSRLGTFWAEPFGRWLVELGQAVGVAPVVVPTLFVVVVRTLNEVLYEAYDILRDADVEAGRARAPRQEAERAA